MHRSSVSRFKRRSTAPSNIVILSKNSTPPIFLFQMKERHWKSVNPNFQLILGCPWKVMKQSRNETTEKKFFFIQNWVSQYLSKSFQVIPYLIEERSLYKTVYMPIAWTLIINALFSYSSKKKYRMKRILKEETCFYIVPCYTDHWCLAIVMGSFSYENQTGKDISHEKETIHLYLIHSPDWFYLTA